MGETGLVTAREREFVTVQLTRTEACANCRACTMGMKTEEMLLRARNECNAEVGDVVEIALGEGVFLRAMAVMYLIPFGMLLLGFAAGYVLGGMLAANLREVIAFVSGVVFMLLGYWWIRKREPQRKRGQFTPSAVAIVPAPNGARE